MAASKTNSLPLRLPEPRCDKASWSTLPAELRQHILHYVFDSFMYQPRTRQYPTVFNRRLSTCLVRLSAVNKEFEQSDLLPALEQYCKVLNAELEARDAGGAWVLDASAALDMPGTMRKVNLNVQLDTIKYFLSFKKMQDGLDPNISFI